MKKRRIIKWILIGTFVALVLGTLWIIGSSTLEHRALIEQEKIDYPAPGLLVDVHGDGDKIHVYSEGAGEKTLVFLSGLGTPSPVYDFQVLTHQLNDHYRTVIVERPGYGWSDRSSTPRDVATVLQETRTALKMAGEQPPYVLLPHSLSGLEAIYWAGQYPDEVEAIMGLDPLVPDYSDDSPTTFSPMIDFLMGTGLVRSQPNVFDEQFFAMKKGHLDESDAQVARSLFYRRVQTKNMKEELERVEENRETVSALGAIDVPFHAFVSTQNDDPAWERALKSYVDDTGGQCFTLDAHHYVHLDEPEWIAQRIRALLENEK